MEFFKNVADALTHKEERAARTTTLETTPGLVQQTTTTTTTVEATPGLVQQTTVATGIDNAEITTMKAATVDVVERAPVVEETIIQEQRESMFFFFIYQY